MAWSGSGSASSAASGGSFSVPGMSVSDIESRVAKIMGYSTSDTDALTAIDEAITAAGQAAMGWQGRVLWYAKGSGTFDTVDGTSAYDLHSVNSAAMVDLWAPTGIWMEDNFRFGKQSYEDYLSWITLNPTMKSRPYGYALYDDLYLGTIPIPDDAYTVTVGYVKRHSKLSGGAGLLSIPAQWHRPVYVDGAVYLLKEDTIDPSALSNSQNFQGSLQAIAAASPEEGYETQTGAMFPEDTRVIIDGGP